MDRSSKTRFKSDCNYSGQKERRNDGNGKMILTQRHEEMTENEIGKVVLVKLVLVNTGNGESTIAGSSLQLEPYVLYS